MPLQRLSCHDLVSFQLLAQQALAAARRSIYWLTPDLEADRWDEAALAQVWLNQIRHSTRLDSRILITSRLRIGAQRHALTALAQRLPSRLPIRQMHPEDANDWRLLLIDRDHRLQAGSNFNGFLAYHDVPLAQQQAEQADYWWQRSREVPELRQLTL